ncbi:MAG: inositol monophosphatase [Bacteroidaceae bacterium]|nr:inositol monophosphatase [Bacteroidaceae bacterium]
MDEINMLSSVIHTVIDASGLMLTDDFRISQKDGAANIVTSSDIAVQEFLCQRLSDLLPGCGFLCEEEDMHDLLHEYTWIIDPIDGTANYSRGIRECAVCVGLKHGEVMELAVVYLPRTDELFAAQRGKGAFLHHPQSGKPSVPLRVSDRPFSNSIMCTALAVYHKEYAQVCSDIIRNVFMECNDIRRFGAAAPELCYLAMGRCELYFEYLLSPWDFAAASLILEEAGGVLCNREGRPLDYTKPSGVLAANSRENLNRLVSIVKDCSERDPGNAPNHVG